MEQRPFYLNTICSITPTLCRLVDVPAPFHSTAQVIGEVMHAAQGMDIKRIEKCLVYAPDAIGSKRFHADAQAFEPVLMHAPLRVSLQSVIPPITPVCFASMFTGALPEVHGIRHYKKPQLACDTLFDALLRAGKRVAIVAVNGSCIDRIFRGRAMDYFPEAYDPQVTERVLDLLREGDYDFILAYHQEYDDQLHKTAPASAVALQAMYRHINSFARLATAAQTAWADYSGMVLFSPDHGAHIDPATGKGVHGLDIPADMRVDHFFGFYPRRFPLS